MDRLLQTVTTFVSGFVASVTRMFSKLRHDWLSQETSDNLPDVLALMHFRDNGPPEIIDRRRTTLRRR